uniref:GPAT/DHAPAT C-terminal domain-containing protein n=1 Tax=Glossina morsitans morsitans TaxID=37546 RepID=A0A1B0F9J5_GLOMM
MVCALKESFSSKQANWIKEPVQAAANFEDGLYVQAVLEVIRKSSVTKSWQRVRINCDSPSNQGQIVRFVRMSTIEDTTKLPRTVPAMLPIQQMLLSLFGSVMGHNVEFSKEVGRARIGKPCMPKGGILSVIVDAFMDLSIPNTLLVSVSVNYERLVDENFVREKQIPESFVKAISSIWKALNSKYGLMRIEFNEPYFIEELVQSYNKIAKEDDSVKIYKPSPRTLQHNQSTSSLFGQVDNVDKFKGRHVDFSLNLLFVADNDQTVRDDCSLHFFRILAYYSNKLAPHFALQSIVLSTFHNLLLKHINMLEENLTFTEPFICCKKLIEAAIDNCEVYRYEYMLYKPTQTLEHVLESAIDELIVQGIIKTKQTENEPESVMESRRIARNLATYLGEDNVYDDMSDNRHDFLDVDDVEEP